MDPSFFDAMLYPIRDRLYAAAHRVTGREADALDALQEALLRMYRGLDRWDGRAAFATWAHRITVRCAIDQVRARRGAAGLSGEGEVMREVPDPRGREGHEPAVAAEEAEAVRAALERLPERQRLVLVLRHYEDLPLAEIAQVLGCALGTVKATLCQGLRNLRSKMEAAHGSV